MDVEQLVRLNGLLALAADRRVNRGEGIDEEAAANQVLIAAGFGALDIAPQLDRLAMLCERG